MPNSSLYKWLFLPSALWRSKPKFALPRCQLSLALLTYDTHQSGNFDDHTPATPSCNFIDIKKPHWRPGTVFSCKASPHVCIVQGPVLKNQGLGLARDGAGQPGGWMGHRASHQLREEEKEESRRKNPATARARTLKFKCWQATCAACGPRVISKDGGCGNNRWNIICRSLCDAHASKISNY